jgi:outer membrane biogenesis lipoprotein LolB
MVSGGPAMMRTVLVVVALTALAGCAEYEAQQRQQAQAQSAAIAANEDAQCRSYGAQPGSPAYIQCRMNFSNQRAQVDANDRAIAMQYVLNNRH